VTEGPLLIFQWIYIIKFIKIKYRKQDSELKWNQIQIFAWVCFVLLFNTFNALFFNISQIIIQANGLYDDVKGFAEFWLVFSEFFFDILLLNNGIAFLTLFYFMGKLNKELILSECSDPFQDMTKDVIVTDNDKAEMSF